MTPIRHLVPVRWILKAVKWLFGGAFASFFLLALASSLSVEQLCYFDCSPLIWLNPISVHNSIFLQHVEDHIIDPPQIQVEDPITAEEAKNPFYNDELDWYGTGVLAFEYLRNIKNGTFIEVGAGDGFYRSLTTKLETLFGWNGLLIEPRKDVYAKLRKRRKAAAANVCASVTDFHTKAQLWTPKVEDDMPEELKRSSESRAALLQYVVNEDRQDGVISEVQCIKLETLIYAYLRKHQPGKQVVDLLILDTSTGELEMFDGLPKDDIFYMVVVHFRDKSELKDIISVSKDYNLQAVSNESSQFNYAIFLHNHIHVINVRNK